MERKKRLGELLVEESILTQKELDQALNEHKKAGQRLGQYLIHSGKVSDVQVVNLLSEKLNLEKYNPGKYPVDVEIVKILSLDIAQKYQVAPVELLRGLLKVAMPDPMDINALDSIETETNCEVEPLICTERELKQLINSTYGLFSDLDGVLESIEEGSEEGEIAAQTEDHIQISSLQNKAGEAPIIRLVNSIISQGVREGASDLHISPKEKSVQIRFRIDGKLHEVPSPPKSHFMSMVTRVKILAKMDISNYRTPQDGRFSVKVGHREIGIRASTIPTIHGENLVLRLLDKGAGILSLDQLGVTKKQQELIEQALTKPYGMILCTGPTGSGKSSTLFAMLNKINRPDIHIVTVEDPVEFRIDNVRQVQLNTKAGMTFASGLRSILRQDPDVIMVGEIRDAETANIAVQAALTGHRVLSTLHTNDSAGAVTRLHDMGVAPFLVSSVMLISIAQRLMRTNCKLCLEPYTPSDQALRMWGEDEWFKNANFQRSKGCHNCLDIGFKGRVGIYEVLCIDETIQTMILEGKTSQEITRSAVASGKLFTLKQSALEKVVQGETTLEEAASAVMT